LYYHIALIQFLFIILQVVIDCFVIVYIFYIARREMNKYRAVDKQIIEKVDQPSAILSLQKS